MIVTLSFLGVQCVGRTPVQRWNARNSLNKDCLLERLVTRGIQSCEGLAREKGRGIYRYREGRCREQPPGQGGPGKVPQQPRAEAQTSLEGARPLHSGNKGPMWRRGTINHSPAHSTPSAAHLPPAPFPMQSHSLQP